MNRNWSSRGWCVALGACLGCGPTAAGPGGSTETDGTAVTDGADGTGATGSVAGTACGPDGIAIGPIAIRTNEEALALSGCTVVEGDLLVDPCHECLGVPAECARDCADPGVLTSLEGLERLERATGSVYVGFDIDPLGDEDRTGHERLSSIDELGGLVEVEGDLHLGYAPSAEAATFAVLERVGGELRVADSFHFDPTFPVLRYASDLQLNGPARATFDFPSLEKVPGFLTVADTSIASVEGAPNLIELGSVKISRNDVIQDLSPLFAVPQWRSFSAFFLGEITELDFPHAGPDSNIAAHFCPALERVSLPPTVQTIGKLSLQDNDALTTIAFPGVVELPDGLAIWDNNALDTLEGLASLEYLGTWLTLVGNPRLCDSEVEAFIEGLQLGVGFDHWNVGPNGGC